MNIRLHLGRFNCEMSTDDPALLAFLAQKYSHCQTHEAPDFLISLKPAQNKVRYHVKRLSRNAYILYISDISNTFLQFNFFIKTIYATYLMEHGSFILHSSTIVRDGKAVLFAGKENHGKSTIVKLLPEYRVLNDDFAIIGKKSDNQYFVHTSPFYEKNSFLKIYQEVLIGKILFLEKSKIVSVN